MLTDPGGISGTEGLLGVLQATVALVQTLCLAPFCPCALCLVDPVYQHQPDLATLLGPAFVSLGFQGNYHKVGMLNLQKVVLLGLRRPKVQNQGARGLGPF